MRTASPECLPSKRLWLILGWALVFIRYVGTVVLAGSLLGGLLFLALKPCFAAGNSWGTLWSRGVRNGCIYSAYWSFSLALVLCLMRWKRTTQASN